MLVSVGMTIRGYNDVNIIDCIFCRPTMSERLYKQAVGRAARMDHENKGFFRLFDYAGNINRFGLWSDDCIYSHNDKPKRIVEFEGIICPNCFEFIQERVNTCPNCNFILKEIREKKEREIEEKKKTSELIEYKSLSIIEELNKLIANGNSFYYHKLRPLKPFNLDVNIFDNTIKKLVKKCIQNNYNPNYIYYKIKDQFKNYK